MTNKQVSIVIPTFNRADYLVECIDSCLAQTQACEIIVCDHGSTDNTPEVVKKYGDRIKYVRRTLDSGVHFCWMDGILHCSNDLIHINYDDDWIKPNFIEDCVKLFDENVGFVFSNATVYYENQKEYSDNLFKLNDTSGVFPVKNFLKFSTSNMVSPGAAIFRKKQLLDNLFVGKVPFTQNEYHGVGPDILFSIMSCIEYPSYGFVNEPLAIFRAHDKSITIDALSDSSKQIKIKNAYNDARVYFYLSKIIKNCNLFSLIKKIKIKK
ncbi:glycosyltransferase family 2 protein [Flavobacterium sp.]|jgi:glycosyltransferase involved in cell wall biosynthesis|uniref:glycosyltransferase family 2 protein n=1 Tax=Flavobacterium sp. TaxID=239 RepID=UPI0037BFAAA5